LCTVLFANGLGDVTEQFVDLVVERLVG